MPEVRLDGRSRHRARSSWPRPGPVWWFIRKTTAITLRRHPNPSQLQTHKIVLFFGRKSEFRNCEENTWVAPRYNLEILISRIGQQREGRWGCGGRCGSAAAPRSDFCGAKECRSSRLFKGEGSSSASSAQSWRGAAHGIGCPGRQGGIIGWGPRRVRRIEKSRSVGAVSRSQRYCTS